MFCHFERSDPKRVARCKPQQKNPLTKTAKHCHFEPFLKGEKSTEFKTHFNFIDTSPKAQYDKI